MDGSQKMKRSEAIKNIANVLRLTGNHYCDHDRDLEDAERILKRMEDIGMRPPFIEVWEDVPNTFLGEGFKVKRIVSEWELEDEEK
jgi:hypothetical protein